jgi:uncharacterized tellurite resistance protein B-like protein
MAQAKRAASKQRKAKSAHGGTVRGKVRASSTKRAAPRSSGARRKTRAAAPSAARPAKAKAAKQTSRTPKKRTTAVRPAAPRSSNGNGAQGGVASEHKPYRLPSHLTVSPDITKHPWENRRDYLILVAAIAASDSELHPDELKLLESWMTRFELPLDARAAVLHVANRGDVDLVEIANRLADTQLTWSVMLDMMGMAMADGILMDDEIMLLRGLANVLMIDPIDFNILIDFVHSAHQAAQLTNPEPLYEHAIESAFQLLSRRNVRLFEHTRLCVNYPVYDQQLKQRWTEYAAAGHA